MRIIHGLSEEEEAKRQFIFNLNTRRQADEVARHSSSKTRRLLKRTKSKKAQPVKVETLQEPWMRNAVKVKVLKRKGK